MLAPGYRCSSDGRWAKKNGHLTRPFLGNLTRNVPHTYTHHTYIYVIHTHVFLKISICTYDHICRGKTYIQKINFLKGQSGNLWGFVPFANPLKMTVNSWHIITEGTSSPKIREYPLKVRGIIPKSTYWYLLLMLEIRSFPILVCKESLGTPRIQGTSVELRLVAPQESSWGQPSFAVLSLHLFSQRRGPPELMDFQREGGNWVNRLVLSYTWTVCCKDWYI